MGVFSRATCDVGASNELPSGGRLSLACPPTAARRRDLGCLSTISMVDIQTGEMTRRPW